MNRRRIIPIGDAALFGGLALLSALLARDVYQFMNPPNVPEPTRIVRGTPVSYDAGQVHPGGAYFSALFDIDEFSLGDYGVELDDDILGSQRWEVTWTIVNKENIEAAKRALDKIKTAGKQVTLDGVISNDYQFVSHRLLFRSEDQQVREFLTVEGKNYRANEKRYKNFQTSRPRALL